jgi:hypothetical protein
MPYVLEHGIDAVSTNQCGMRWPMRTPQILIKDPGIGMQVPCTQLLTIIFVKSYVSIMLSLDTHQPVTR